MTMISALTVACTVTVAVAMYMYLFTFKLFSYVHTYNIAIIPVIFIVIAYQSLYK